MSKLVEWCVVKVRGSAAQQLAIIKATDAKAAIKKAIKEYEIADAHTQQRLAAYRWDG